MVGDKGGDAEQAGRPPRLERFIGEPTRDHDDWYWLWSEDRSVPLRSHRRGWIGRLIVAAKRLLRPWVRAPVADLWDRQRVFNLILLERLRAIDARIPALESTLEAHSGHLATLDARTIEATAEVMQHNDALFARVDQKLDRYRREARELWGRLGALIVAAEGQPVSATGAAALRDRSYTELERRHRGSEEEIAERVTVYLPHLQGRGPVLDLGCGRGELLEVLAREGIEARGIDANAEMVRRCTEKGLEARSGDLLEELKATPEGSLGGVVLLHVVEHLAPGSIEPLARLAWKALRPGGLIALETPSPLSVVTASRNFWVDPTHRRPVHPASLELALREAGFEPVHRLDLHPFPAEDRLPEIDLAAVPEEQRELAEAMNRWRDLLDELLFGHRDYALLGARP